MSGDPDRADETAVAAGLTVDGVTFDTTDARLLRAVAEAGSVSGAAERLGRSRARALGRLDDLESAFGSLLERRRGGADGGGSRLTGDGRSLLERFDRLQAVLAGTVRARESVFHGRVAATDGDTVVVATSVGRVRGLAVEAPVVDDRVAVSVRSDAVTLQAPEATPPADATSARNRLAGTVDRLDRSASVVAVTVAVGGDEEENGESVEALVTADSADRLDLAVGDAVTVSFKTTAARAVPVR
ncbi:TOBE domain-containing protein [Halobaculum sp. MBLA0143]|uniref:TOBE domain-containing protein n=1 Tax=Halobaculum sp. MBLA0143 TaxID=3079933 RepID=UPI003524175C